MFDAADQFSQRRSTSTSPTSLPASSRKMKRPPACAVCGILRLVQTVSAVTVPTPGQAGSLLASGTILSGRIDRIHGRAERCGAGAVAVEVLLARVGGAELEVGRRAVEQAEAELGDEVVLHVEREIAVLVGVLGRVRDAPGERARLQVAEAPAEARADVEVVGDLVSHGHRRERDERVLADVVVALWRRCAVGLDLAIRRHRAAEVTVGRALRRPEALAEREVIPALGRGQHRHGLHAGVIGHRGVWRTHVAGLRRFHRLGLVITRAGVAETADLTRSSSPNSSSNFLALMRPAGFSLSAVGSSALATQAPARCMACEPGSPTNNPPA